MKIKSLLAALVLSLVIGLPASVIAQGRGVETGTEGWDVNGQPGTTNQGGLAHGMPGIVIARFGGSSHRSRALYHRTRPNRKITTLYHQRRNHSQDDLLGHRYGDNPYGYNF